MASTVLSRTPSSAGNRKIWTFSTWIKRTQTGSTGHFFSAASSGSTYPTLEIALTSVGQLIVSEYNGSGYNVNLWSTAYYRDPAAWYHIVVAVDTTQATETNRVKIYVNGVQITAFNTTTYYSQNLDTPVNSTNIHTIGRNATSGASPTLESILAHTHLIDGTQYAASDFGSFDANGIWTPNASPSVTYGTNGFFLDMANSSDMGNDVSGNNNDFTVTGTVTQALDTPSNVFATMNAIDNSNVTLSNGSLTCSCASPSGIRSTFGVTTGKWYIEVKYQSTTSMCGVVAMEQAVTTQAIGATIFGQSGGSAPEFFLNGSFNSAYSSAGAFSSNDIMQIALDMDSNTVYFGKNGSWFGGTSWTESTPTTGHTLTSGYTYGVRASTGSGTSVNIWNFGNGYFGTTAVASGNADSAGLGIFEYTVPSGYYSLCTKNIATYG